MNEFLLSIRDLSAGYGSRPVISNIDLTIRRGEWFSLLGPNATGKSTLLYCATGQLAPIAGVVHLSGHNLSTAPQAAKRHVGYAHAPDRLPGLLTGLQCLEVYAAARQLAEVGPEIAGLARDLKLTPLLDQYVGTYSLGTRQKLSVLLALVGKPSLIVLDEAFNGLDPASSLVLKRFLQARVHSNECSVLLATHALDIVLQYSTRAALLLDGRLTKSWDAEALAELRQAGIQSLEEALATDAEARSISESF
jgi:ABC-2 type transport system ATP-binding protein